MKTREEWKPLIDDLIFGRMSESAFISAIQSDARAEETERANKAEAELIATRKNFDMQAEWLLEWKRVAESLKASQPHFLSLNERLQKAEAACAEMRFLIGEATRMLANYSHYWPADRQQFYANVQQRCDSTDFGKDFVPRMELETSKATLSLLRQLLLHACFDLRNASPNDQVRTASEIEQKVIPLCKP